ncbi:hypothetical protein [Polyangium aurulentum]|uniref:hypothetical protein n=1 Tax=Polyangium aurulentum TaxID=2567896 RepID=UPI0010ADE87F|nr:hypothetical protein [Polyangium aurulentum]UQA56702.1 hypothetical protein E8A73_036180 [Polyangium aurulentum]
MDKALLRRLLVGAAAGALATVPMTGVMLGAQRLGLMGKLPPRKITDAALSRVGIHPSRKGRKLLTTLSHLGYGAACGALFTAVRGERQSRLGSAGAGALYASMVWLLSYAGWVPALDIMPRPTKDRNGRPTSMVVAHLVYGTSLGALA